MQGYIFKSSVSNLQSHALLESKNSKKFKYYHPK